jgi:hypothetical protein
MIHDFNGNASKLQSVEAMLATVAPIKMDAFREGPNAG